jgi:hypothetical protein
MLPYQGYLKVVTKSLFDDSGTCTQWVISHCDTADQFPLHDSHDVVS